MAQLTKQRIEESFLWNQISGAEELRKVNLN